MKKKCKDYTPEDFVKLPYHTQFIMVYNEMFDEHYEKCEDLFNHERINEDAYQHRIGQVQFFVDDVNYRVRLHQEEENER